MLYRRDPSVDPQMVRKGKDEQDAAGLAVPIVPIYIQVRIESQALFEKLRRGRAEVLPGRRDLPIRRAERLKIGWPARHRSI